MLSENEIKRQVKESNKMHSEWDKSRSRKLDSKVKSEVRYTVEDILSDDLLPTHRKVDKIMELIHSIM